MDLFLRIAPELYLKRCVVGGLERVYEITGTSGTRASPLSTTRVHDAGVLPGVRRLPGPDGADGGAVPARGADDLRERSGHLPGPGAPLRAPVARLSVEEALVQLGGLRPDEVRTAEGLRAAAAARHVPVNPAWGWRNS